MIGRPTLLFFSMLLCFVIKTRAQQVDYNRLVQFSGIVSRADDRRPASFALLQVNGDKRFYQASINGGFSFVTYKGSDIVISAVGCKPMLVHIPDTISGYTFTKNFLLKVDTIFLPSVTVYPWRSYEQFKKAFVSDDIPDDGTIVAERNMVIAEEKNKANPISFDGRMNQREQVQDIVRRNYWRGQYQPNNLLSPMAWAQFFQALQNGDLKIEK